MVRITSSGCLVVLISLGLAGCGGGGGGGGDASPGTGTSLPPVPVADPRPAPDPVAAAQPASSFETTEFNGTLGPAKSGAQHAYALGATGAGVTVAVIDTGIDPDHPELAGRISPLSKDITPPEGKPLSDETGHGTSVAGVIAAIKDGSTHNENLHGVAFDATILLLDVEQCTTTPDGVRHCAIATDWQTEAINYAVDNGAHVINMSLGGGYPVIDIDLWQALRYAATAGVITVISAGNDGLSDPHNPAKKAADPALLGNAIAVAAVDRVGNMPSWSNRCGIAKDFCLVATGRTLKAIRSGGGYHLVSGTSFSAPVVSGAAALLIQLWPNVAAKDIVQILLTSATDLGEPGVDEIFGHGLLNLEEAVKAQGPITVALSGSAADGGPLAINSRLTLGPAFGDALKDTTAFANAIGFDKFKRAYPIDLSRNVNRVKRTFAIDALLAPGEAEIRTAKLGAGTKLRVSLNKEDKPGAGTEEAEARGRDIGSVLFSSDIGDQSKVSLGYRTASAQQFDLSPGTRAGKGLFLVGVGGPEPASRVVENRKRARRRSGARQGHAVERRLVPGKRRRAVGCR